MPSSTIISLAILKVNWDTLKKDYLENFVPIVAECIRLSPNDVVSVPVLQEELQTRFGLNFPQNAIKTILGRVHKREYIRSENKIYIRNPKKLSQLEFHPVQQQVMRMHESLINSLVKFCSEKFHINWSVEDAETALQSYLEDDQLLVMGAATCGTLVPTPKHAIKSAKYFVGAFVQYLQETHAADFDYLETIVKGNMLANAIFLPEPTKALKRFRNTHVYFDTSFLIFALGYAGKARRDPCVELLQLLYETGADLRCFRHTLDEIRGALDACTHLIAQGLLKDAYGPSIDYFLSKGYTASDIELFSVQLEKNLDILRIRVVDKPAYVHEYVIDEQKLTEALKNQIKYSNPSALIRDVDSISAIMRLRRGQDFFAIEVCQALFVTTNLELAQVSREFFCQNASPGAVSPCLTDYTLTNLLWLKKPLKAPDLPRKRIIADCYAATQPDERLWRLYLVEIDKLERSGQVTADDYYLLRHSLEAKSALMELTHGGEEAFTQGTVPEILDILHSQIQADIRLKLESETTLRKEAEREIETMKARESGQISRVEARARKYARATAQILKFGVLFLLSIGIISTFPWELPKICTSIFRYGIPLLQAALLILLITNLMYGTTLQVYLRRFEIVLSQWIQKRLLSLLER